MMAIIVPRHTRADSQQQSSVAATFFARETTRIMDKKPVQLTQSGRDIIGATENAGLENAGPSKMQGWKTRDWKTRDRLKGGWKTRDQNAGVENAGLENTGPSFRGWKTRPVAMESRSYKCT